MINNVMVKVVGEQKSNRDESAVEPIELVTNGNLHEKNGIFYLKYDEYYEIWISQSRTFLSLMQIVFHSQRKAMSVRRCLLKWGRRWMHITQHPQDSFP